MSVILILRKLVLLAFLSCGFITLTAALFSDKLHWLSETMVFYITYFGYTFIAVLLILYKPNLFSRIPFHWGWILLFFFGYSLFLMASGYKAGNPMGTWLVDSVTFTAFVGFIFLGTSDDFWKDFQKFGFYFFVAAILVNIRATTMVNVNYWLSEENLFNFKGSERITRSIVAYKTQFSQSFWPLFLLTVNPKNKGRMIFMLFAVVFLLFQQIIFQKRGPTIRILFFIGCFFYLALKNRRYLISTIKFRQAVLIFFLLLGASVILFNKYGPMDLFRNQYTALVSRFEGNTGNANIRYSRGVLGVFTSENERIREVGMMLQSLDFGQFVSGKYFGGKYEDREIMERERDATHIGFFNFLLKGGILYLGLFLAIVFGVFAGLKKYKKNREIMACFLIFFVMTFFLLAEGWFYYRSAVYDLLLYGVVIGRLILVKNGQGIPADSSSPVLVR